MAQSTEKNYAGTPDDQDRRASRRDRDEAKRMVDGMDEKKKSSTFAALDSIKKRYFNRLLGDKGIKVKSPKVSSVEETSLGKITTIPKIVQRNMNEIEIQPILKNFSYVRIDVVMTDIQVEDVSCDGVRVPLYIYHRKYGSIPSNLKFENAEELDSFVVWLAQRSGKHISVAQPMLDATIPDGSRLQATLGMHVTKRGSSFTIRRFRENPFTPLDLVRFKTMSPEMMAYLWLSIENGQSMLICGGTASGKTTTLNAILLFIPPQMKIVSIEDTRELNLPHEHCVPLLTRAGFGGRHGQAPTREGDRRGRRDGPGVERADHELRVHVEPGR